ncbi:MAG TPA: class I SAM-dependent methyltransferase [Desulfosalsimonadaceae bacterium]|nr:class I SAM-dependent methyltransferase [Desulfosalsimonadaceae bacterium]
MGYVFDHKEAEAYDQWLNQRGNQVALELENRLMLEMIQPLCGKRLIDIGCGTGHSLLPFLDKGAYLTGVDASPYMLDIAHAKLGHRVELHRAYAEDLPFDDNYFHYACLCLTLEFVDDPRKALAEACRVAKDGVFVGVLNKYALKAINRRIKSIFRPTVYSQACFFSIGDIKHLFRMLIGDVPIFWRTVCLLPGRSQPFVYRLETSKMLQKNPFGAFAGIMALPVPRFRTTPLTLKVVSNRANPANQVISCPGHSTGTHMIPHQMDRAASSD